MSATLISNNTTMKVNRKIVASDVINANAYAVASYVCTGIPVGGSSANTMLPNIYYGPGDVVAPTIGVFLNNNGNPSTATYTFLTGVEFINTP